MEPLEEKILHIDEDDTTQDIVKDIFRKIDVKVDSAGTFNEAWEYLQNKGYEKYTGLVISAELYGEEGRNGIDLAREALKLGFDSDKYPLIMVAPKNKIPELQQLPEVQAKQIDLVEEAKHTEEPNEIDIIALYMARRGL